MVINVIPESTKTEEKTNTFIEDETEDRGGK